MKKIILIAVLLISFASANSQSNYTYIAQRYRWLAGLFEALGLPAGSGPAAFAAGQNQRAGQVYYDSSGIDQGVYVWTGLTWQLIAGGSQTLQEVFDTEVGGSVLTKSDTVLLNGFNLTIKGPGTTQYDFQPTQFNFLNQNAGSSTQITGTAGGGFDAIANFAGTNNGSNLNLSDGFARLNAQNTLGPESNIYVYPDSIALAPQGGALKFRGIVSGAGTVALRYNPSTNAVTYGDTSASSSSVTANLRIERADGSGIPIWYVRTTDTTLMLKDFKGSGGINVTTLTDSTVQIAPDATIVNTTGTQTLSNKRWSARVESTTSSATPTINTDNVDIYKLTAQAADITSFTTNLSGTPVDGDILEIQITGTAARAITWGSSFVSSSVALPTTTITTVTLTVVLQWFTTSSYGNNKWICVNSF